MSELLNTEQAAKILQVTPATLMVWRSTKRYPLKFVRVGRNVRYRSSDLEAFLDARTQSGLAAQPTSGSRRRAR
jgi:predicted DNA-binding transcriptional regulator AlpA